MTEAGVPQIIKAELAIQAMRVSRREQPASHPLEIGMFGT